MAENDATGVDNMNGVKPEDAVRAPPRYPSSLHLRCGLRDSQHRTARLALPETSNANSGESEGDEEEEEEGSEEEDGDPLADLPDETEVRVSPWRLLG